MAPGENGSYNVHTGTADFGGAISVSEIDDLETINAADGQIDFGAASLVNVNGLNALTVNATDVNATDGNFASVNTGSLQATLATLGLATLDTLTAALATITDLTVDILRLTGTLRVVNFVSSGLAEFGNVVVYGNTEVKNLVVTGSLSAGNIIHEVNTNVYADGNGYWTWQHAPLTNPVLYVVTALNGRNLDTLVKLDQQSATSVRCYLYVEGPLGIRSIDTDRNELHLLAIGS
jgi:hypothetical protein